MTIRISTTTSVGSRIGGTAGGVLYVNSLGQLGQDAADFYWDDSNNRLGIGKNNPSFTIDALGSTVSNYAFQIQNSNSAGTAGLIATNDASAFSLFGYGGSGRSDLLQSSGFLTTSAGPFLFSVPGSNTFTWAIGGNAAANQVMKLDATAKLALGLASTITGSIDLSGSTSGTVTVKAQNAAGTWTMPLPNAKGSTDDVLTWDATNVTKWAPASGGGGGMSIGGTVTSGTTGSILFVGSGPVLAQDNSNFFWDVTNHRLGILTTSPSFPFDLKASLSGGTLTAQINNTHADGNSGLFTTNDMGHICLFGMGGSGSVSSLFRDKGFIYSTNGGLVLLSADSSNIYFSNGSAYVGVIQTADGFMGLGTTSPQGPFDLQGTASGGGLVALVKNLATDGHTGLQMNEVGGNLSIIGHGGSTRGDNFQDRGFMNTSGLGWNISTLGDNIIEFTVDGHATTDRVFMMRKAKFSFFGVTPAVQQTSGADLTNSVTSGGSSDVIADFTNLVVYATDAATIRNDIYQLSRKLKQVNDALRVYGILS